MPVFDSIFGDHGRASGQSPQTREEVQKARNRGEYLVHSVAACGRCHSKSGLPNAPLSGGRTLNDEFGEVLSPNITSDKRTGIGEWSIPEIVRALRASIDRAGRPLSIDSHAGFRWLSAQDALSIAVYLRGTSPVKNTVERRTLGGFERNAWGIIPRHSEVKGYVPDLVRAPTVGYGWYIVNAVAQCAACHTDGKFIANTDKLTGSLKGWADDERKEQVSTPAGGPDIRGSEGLKGWKTNDLISYLRTGRTATGKKVSGSLCPWPFYRGMNDVDMKALELFLRRL